MKFLKNFEGKILTKKEQRKIQGGTICGFGKCVTLTEDGVWEYQLDGYNPLELRRYDEDFSFDDPTFI